MATKYVIGSQNICDNAIRAIADLPMDWSHEVIIQPSTRKRTLDQNNLYFYWLGLLADETGYTKNQWHEFFKETFIKPKIEMITMFDKKIPEKRTTTTRENVGEFIEYLQEIELWVMDNLGYSFPVDDDYRKAMKNET